MKIIALEYSDPTHPDRPAVTDLVSELDVADCTRLAQAAGLAVRNLGAVAWRELADATAHARNAAWLN